MSGKIPAIESERNTDRRELGKGVRRSFTQEQKVEDHMENIYLTQMRRRLRRFVRA